MRKETSETEREFFTRFNMAAWRCGIVYVATKKITTLIYLLRPTVRSMVARPCDLNRSITSMGIEYFVEHKEDAAHVLMETLKPNWP